MNKHKLVVVGTRAVDPLAGIGMCQTYGQEAMQADCAVPTSASRQIADEYSYAVWLATMSGELESC